ncbi:ATP-binding cassette subfamily B protein [Streptosporangium becharense]|uniref:ATP-binding cassette subfamily B protein n=1 Tax=Streptosporangium becharense TaxID=1816182 RepID=A0A7W9INN7_9ACTN|nr:ABC transporter ATP-binding protein [Streptosporangium becharense]MBB2914529.1 ATP-binding cassette subfamily B protein [Streptosporangium becharense]MBB5823374.1 ATP-binding cassette subfamily B protein [Streptosporangium becharense]
MPPDTASPDPRTPAPELPAHGPAAPEPRDHEPAPPEPRDLTSPAWPAPPPRRPRRRIDSLWRLRTYLRPHVPRLVLIWIPSFAAVGIAIVIPLVGREIIDGPVARGDRGGVVPLALLALALGTAEALLILLRRRLLADAVLDVETRIRDDLYRHLQRLPMAFHSSWQSGQLLSRVTTDLSAIRRFLGFGLLFLVLITVQIVTVTGLLLSMYWPLGLLVVASAVPIVITSLRFERGYITVSRKVQDEQGDLATVVEEAAAGIRTIKAFGRGRHVSGVFDEGARKVYLTSMEKVRLSGRFFTFLEVIPNVTLALVLLLGALAVGAGTLTLGALVAFSTLMLQLVWPVSALGFILSMGQEAMTSADRVMEVLDTEPGIVGGTRALGRPRGHLRFEGVGFTFPGAAGPVLRDVWLEVRPGETVAVVGATGSGKTTLTALVPRLHDVGAGRITIDGVDVRDLPLPVLRSIVATAFEEPTLFSMSVRENLTLGRHDATGEEIEAALRVAQAGFVHRLPWGLETRIGEQGLSLSGGQRQRLALARAVLSRPRVLVLDDTLSALDVETEALVEEALRHVLRDATGIVVAHRASTVLLADRVALLLDGTVAHVGRHEELMATVPEYRALLSAAPESEEAVR